MTIRECEGKMQISRIEFPHQLCISVWNQNLPCNRIVSLSYPSISKVILIVDDSFDFKACVIWCHHARSIWLWQGSRNGDQFTILRNIWVCVLTFCQSRHLKEKKIQVSIFTGFLIAKIFNFLPEEWQAIPKWCVIAPWFFKANWSVKVYLLPESCTCARLLRYNL